MFVASTDTQHMPSLPPCCVCRHPFLRVPAAHLSIMYRLSSPSGLTSCSSVSIFVSNHLFVGFWPFLAERTIISRSSQKVVF